MTDTEIALRAAINLLRDSVESGNMPSGEKLTAESRALHEHAADHLEGYSPPNSRWPPPTGNPGGRHCIMSATQASP